MILKYINAIIFSIWGGLVCDVDFYDNKVRIKNAVNFNLMQTLDCGQAFRWKQSESGVWSGVAYGKYIEIYNDRNDIIIDGTTKEEYYNIWRSYFDIDRDYSKIIQEISSNETLCLASGYGYGIRILQQETWEALCSFIISQNNNIPRIKGIIERLCENFGEKCGIGYTFPSAEKIACLTVGDLSPLRCGFRARYIIDAAQKVSSGQIDLKALKDTDYETAKNKLMTITGVGPKVADCTLLYGLGRIEAFPEDVWIKRAMKVLFNGNLPKCAVPYAGIVQQYIFYYARGGNLNV